MVGVTMLKTRSSRLMPIALLLFTAISMRTQTLGAKNRDWPIYGGSPGADHYSPLAQINRSNVKQLQVAWAFDSEEIGGLQTSPIVVYGVLYGISTSQRVFALDAATRKLKWKFDSGVAGTQPNRGLAYWENGTDRRLIVGRSEERRVGKECRSRW